MTSSSVPSGDIPWEQGVWSNPPAAVENQGSDLLVTAVETSDAWRHTSYGFVHDTEHALLAPFRPGTAMEVEYTADFSAQFDQAGLFIRAAQDHWTKAATEFSDGHLSAGAVVTDGASDWSLSPADDWLGQRVLVRASWSDDAITVRAGLLGGELRLLRVFPFPARDDVAAGPLVCAPTRAGLTVTFHAWRTTEADVALHP
ncbi:DUF1349 domain-containing protein [Nesterenkonia sp. PF2B19]|uniref:DUF1349 domain-containing protein n=1 Tax=Nesterenkonia sp. PF2B19 TaxID=1881858 RepID=UPI0008727020|nr:DUF1349 domain-containing protein [Nesterenkonia sp. PF2B19]OSM42252.1 hypothetical protein BCY76_015565 [Nesterenkonia sp. PF2B19]